MVCAFIFFLSELVTFYVTKGQGPIPLKFEKNKKLKFVKISGRYIKKFLCGYCFIWRKWAFQNIFIKLVLQN
jgi:hypothetical protein